MKDWILVNFEHLYNSIKFLGFFKGFKITYHFININLFHKKKVNQIYHFCGLKFSYTEFSSLWELFNEIFTLSPYYFKSNVRSPYIVDVGANIGDSMLYFKFLYPKSKILAVEPHPEAFKLLQQNIINNNFSDVELWKAALGSKTGMLTLYLDDTKNYRASGNNKNLVEIVQKKRTIKNDKTYSAIKVPIKRLSTYKTIRETAVIDLLKIDAEGAETEILMDAEKNKILQKTRKIILEYHFPFGNKSENSLDTIIRILQRNNYSIGGFNLYRNTINSQHDLTLMIVGDSNS